MSCTSSEISDSVSGLENRVIPPEFPDYFSGCFPVVFFSVGFFRFSLKISGLEIIYT